jgi:hypothetical protein
MGIDYANYHYGTEAREAGLRKGIEGGREPARKGPERRDFQKMRSGERQGHRGGRRKREVKNDHERVYMVYEVERTRRGH